MAGRRLSEIQPTTGQKLFMSLEYAFEEPGLNADLFVKFSRDFADARRDRQRYEMMPEARFAALSRPSWPLVA